MPNGGMPPSCLSCKWSEKSEDFGEALRHCYCKHHSMEVLFTFLTFCTDRTTQYDETTPGSFIQSEGITGHDVYFWVASDPEWNDVFDTYSLLAPLEIYANWTQEQKLEAIKAKRPGTPNLDDLLRK